ncbi:MAG TPA: alpha-ketoglutarate-dependent dioxygenase AlkB, partial [Acidimicrobiaceae bacterium]|nr:alpha-ketoglutarate-dependent dioxygenase AlkB [Acidimicrobiaceae bacterium]
MSVHAPLQGSLFGAAEPHLTGPLPEDREDLAHGAWIVRVPGWVGGDQT